MRIIGLTGGIGSGKTTVALILKEYGAVIIEADSLGKEVVEKNAPAYFEIINEFGLGILDKFGSINRKKLGEIVFNDQVKLEMLNKITHKYIIKKIKEQIEFYRALHSLDSDPLQVRVSDATFPIADSWHQWGKKNPTDAKNPVYKESKLIVLEAIVPVKEGFLDIVDEVWVVVSDIKNRTKRVMKRDDFDYNEVMVRLNAQKDDNYYIGLADRVIKNNSNTLDLRKEIENIMHFLVNT